MHIFMIGMPRSGTSILSEAFSLHEDLAFLSNYNNSFPSFPSLALISQLANIEMFGVSLRGSKKQKKGAMAFARKYLPHSMEAFPVWEYCCGRDFSFEYLLDTKAEPGVVQKTRNYMSTVLKCQQKARLFAKFTGPSRASYLRSIFPGCYFINVLRDPRSVVASLLHVDFWKEGGGGG